MSLASSSGGGHNLAQIFGNLLQQENQEIGIPMESEMMQAAREGPFESNVELEESDSRADQSGVKPTREEDTAMEMGLDFSALAMQLLEQAQAQGLLTGNGQQPKEEEEDSNSNNNQQQSEEPVPNCSSATSEESAQNKSASNAGIPSKSRSSGHSGSRRSGSKSLLSAAAAAALLAPSPLGQIPSIPGAIAVAVSPAAQLFREDDWSWHRNPAAAIRSGGLNKQTPVWKYFVYNKTENLSRCIVGNCTYQLKGPHTSTLACHLKKHPAEHAEFQRLKSEYTRERIAAGHGQAGGQQDGGEGEGSGCSTPISSQSNNNGFLLPTSRHPQSSESRRKTSHSPSALGCPFPSVVPADPCQQQNIGDGGDDSSGAGSSSLSSSPEPAQQFSWIPPHHDQQQHQQHPQMSAGPAPPNGGGGIFAGLPPINGFHHFMMAAALAASQQHNNNSNGRHQEQLQRHQQKQTPHNSADEQPQGQSSGGDGGLANGGAGIQQQPPGTGKLMPLNELNGGGGCCTGANLLGILNLLSTRAAQLEEEEDIKEKQLIISNQSAGQCRAKSQEFLKSQGAENEAEEEQMQRRRGRKRAASSGGGPERGEEAEAKSTTGADASTASDQPRETVSSSRRGGMAPQQHPPGLAAHSVEHLLSRGGGGGVPSSIGASSRPRDSPPPLAPQMDALLNGLALSLGTGLPRHELCHLLQNPFLGGCWTGLSLGRVDRVLDQHLKLLKRQMGDQLARADPGAMALMAELSCARCWNVPFGNQCLVKGCDGPSQFWCSLSVSFRPAKPGGQRRSLLLAVRQVGAEAMTSRLEEIMAHLNLPKNIRPSLLLIRPMHLANLKFPCKIRCLPALFPDCLEWAFREALIADESMDRLLEAFLRMLETFSSSWQGQNEWRALTGQHLGPLPALTKEDHGQQKMSLLAIAEIVLQWREEFVEIAARHATLEVEETLLSQEEWRLLAELVRLLTVFRSEMRKGEGHNRIRLGQISPLLEDVHRRLQNEFKALDDFPEKLSAILRGKTDEWMTERAKSLSAELLNVPCAPVSLSEVFGRNGNGREWIGEEERWLERSALLLFNNDLLKEDGPEASASGSN